MDTYVVSMIVIILGLILLHILQIYRSFVIQEKIEKQRTELAHIADDLDLIRDNINMLCDLRDDGIEKIVTMCNNIERIAGEDEDDEEQ